MQVHNTSSGIISWFARNPVAANLLMIILLVGGTFSALLINKEVFPRFELNRIQVSVAYPGATPDDIEQGIILKIEEAIEDVTGMEKITSIARESVGSVTIEVADGYETKEVLDDIKRRIDGISTFPASIETPEVFQLEPRNNVIWVSVYGELGAREQKNLAKAIRDELAALPSLSGADLSSVLKDEIAIEVSENQLRKFGLTFSQVAAAVQKASLDLPAGSIRTEGGDILLRTKGQAYYGDDFNNLTLGTRPDGSRLLLSDVATINDGFEDRMSYTRFNGNPAAIIEVVSVDDQDALAISKEVKKYIEKRRASLPDGAKIDTWGDLTHYLEGRLNMMLSNMFYGALLVFLILALFLDLKLAFWVMMGLPVCFLGTLMVMPMEPFNLTINLLTLFAFILVLGIVVDDAIVIGESSYSEIERNGHSVGNVIVGARRVALPATFGVLTTVAAFLPTIMVTGTMSVIWKSIGMVVILCLLFSLVESKLILPAHLAHMRYRPNRGRNPFSRAKLRFHKALDHFIHHSYRRFIKTCISWRYHVLAAFAGVLILAGSLLASGQVRWVFFPNIPSDFLQVSLDMETGTAEKDTLKALQKVEHALYATDEKLAQEFGSSVVKHSLVSLESATKAFLFIELTKSETREIDGISISNALRDAIPPLAGVKKLSMDASTNNGGGAIAFRLQADNLEALSGASQALKEKLATYEGVFDITDNFGDSSEEIRLSIRPEAEALGLTLSDLATQVRYAFYGFEAQRILRNKEEVKVMVRYPSDQRRSLSHLESMMIRTPDGIALPFSSAANMELSESFVSINRIDGKRAVSVTANADKTQVEPGKIAAEISKEFLPTLPTRFPGVTVSLEGETEEEQKAIFSLAQGFFFALFTVYALMAIPLKSYTQPLIIMSVIPFGVIGAVVGHFLLGLSMSVLSMMGIIALAGVVVNDSLILVDFVNRARREDGVDKQTAVVEAGCYRFRAIMLTSLTTFFGLVPILLETSLQAKIVIPMATSLAFGILFSTLVTLILIPVLYIVMDDFRRFFVWWWKPGTGKSEREKA
ncbi:efflux RND transporter permease subunit [Parasalinivibrio latis]|uniref:efflux RND transporter permease subunit n=1 Tax=Parasalinivibrio latis TaxID=2952610 RepID=UPI0030DFC764